MSATPKPAVSYLAEATPVSGTGYDRRMPKGSVEHLHGDRWKVRIDLKQPGDTKRRWRTKNVRAADEHEAHAALRAFAIELGVDPDVPDSLADLLDRYYHHSKGRRTHGSNRAVRISIERHLKPGIGHLSIGRLSVVDLEQFYARKAAEGLAPQTIRHMHFVVQPALRLAVRWGWLGRNVAEDVELDPLNRGKIDPPSVEVVVALVERCSDEAASGRFPASADLHDFAWVSALSGARDGEVSAIRWRDLDLDTAVLSINGSIEVIDGVPVRNAAKTAKSHRRISIDSATVEMLRRRKATAGANGPEDFVFADSRFEPYGSRPVRPDCWTQRWRRLCDRAGVHVRLHDLRHFHASALFDDGARVERVSARLGHARTSTTQDVYGHLLRPDDADLAESIGARFRRDG